MVFWCRHESVNAFSGGFQSKSLEKADDLYRGVIVTKLAVWEQLDGHLGLGDLVRPWFVWWLETWWESKREISKKSVPTKAELTRECARLSCRWLYEDGED